MIYEHLTILISIILFLECFIFNFTLTYEVYHIRDIFIIIEKQKEFEITELFSFVVSIDE